MSSPDDLSFPAPRHDAESPAPGAAGDGRVTGAPETGTESPTSPDPTAPVGGTASEDAAHRRIDALDWARGVAITLMILSHGVKGLLDFEQFPPWGLVPVHAITKFASSLFILVFGMALAVTCRPKIGTPEWPRRRLRLLLRGVTILFWYKVLTIVEMVPRHSEQEVLDALLWRSFPVFCEILGFYGIALLWLPLVLPLWFRAPLAIRLAVPPLLALLSLWVAAQEGMLSEPVQALLVEHESHYTWGQLARAPLVFLGLVVGDLLLAWHAAGTLRRNAAILFGSACAALAAAFLALTAGTRAEDLVRIAHNDGKHPPELVFMVFSVAGACLVLTLAFLGGRPLARILRPITVIGRNALLAFIVHIFVLCVFYRHLLGHWRTVDYGKALELTAVMFVLTVLFIEIVQWMRRAQRPAS